MHRQYKGFEIGYGETKKHNCPTEPQIKMHMDQAIILCTTASEPRLWLGLEFSLFNAT